MTTRVALVVVACLCTTALAATVQWNPSCNGEQPWFSPSMANCFVPIGLPTLKDELIFPAGTNVTLNKHVGSGPYNAIMTQSVVIAKGAVVTFINGMLVVDDNITVLGSLIFMPNSSLGVGAGPMDDGYNRPVPDYQLPGFTPNIIGHNEHWSGDGNYSGVQTTMYVEGSVSVRVPQDWAPQYPAFFINIEVGIMGKFSADLVYLFCNFKNRGTMRIDSLYLLGDLKNEVSGRGWIGYAFESREIINNGHLTWNGWYQDHISAKFTNYGTLVFTEEGDEKKLMGHSDGSLGEREIRGPVDNRGHLILETKRIRSDRYKFVGTLDNSGEISVKDCGAAFAQDMVNRGVIRAKAPSNFCSFHGRFRNDGTVDARDLAGIVFHHDVSNSGSMNITNARAEMRKDVRNAGTMDFSSNRVDMMRGLRNTGNVTVKHLGTNIFAVEDDVVNEGTMDIGATHAALKRDLFNGGLFAVRDTMPQRTRCFVEGRTYSTGDFRLQHAHLTVTTLLQHGDSRIDLSTATSTLTLGTWGTSLQRGVARGYLRRETAEDAVCNSAESVSAQQQQELGNGPVSCVGSISCSECCPESELCMVYSDNVYCDGYNMFDTWQAEPEVQRFMLSESTVAQMPSKMKETLAGIKFSHPHVFSGHVIVNGPGAVTTTDTIEVQGHLDLADGAELFSMVEHEKGVAVGTGTVSVHHCSKWFLGNSAAHAASLATPNISVHNGGSLVVPHHAEVSLEAGHVHVGDGGHLHVDGLLSTGGKFELHATEGFRTSGKGKLARKTN